MLRRLTQSEKNSLDLDRPAAEQEGIFGHGSGIGIGIGIGAGGFEYDYGPASRSSHDGFTQTQTGRRGYHNRSTSGTSQFSTATTGSGQRAGSFVHPFQQTPRPYTPPGAASYADSLREGDGDGDGGVELHSTVGHSPALTEDEDSRHHHHQHHNHHNPHRRHHISRPRTTRTGSLTAPASPSPSPSTSTFPTLRIQTKSSTSRLALATSNTSAGLQSPALVSPTDTMSPSSMRPSMDHGFRIRSRSDVNTRDRSTTIQEERRKFEAREQAKEEKAAKEEIRQREKRNQREARAMDSGHRRSSASEGIRAKRSKSDLSRSEKVDGGFATDYNSTSRQNPPYFEAATGLPPPPRAHKKESPKRKTHGAWTSTLR